MAVHFATLTEENCTLTIDARNVFSGNYAVAIQMEDFETELSTEPDSSVIRLIYNLLKKDNIALLNDFFKGPCSIFNQYC